MMKPSIQFKDGCLLVRGELVFETVMKILKESKQYFQNIHTLKIDFSDVISLAPSWADEFFAALRALYGDRVKYLPTDNQSVIETLKIINFETTKPQGKTNQL